MGHYTPKELQDIGFAKIGRNVLISRDARIYKPGRIEIGDETRIDDFCILSGDLILGRNVHLAPGTQLAAGAGKIVLDDFAGCAFNVVATASSDDYTGSSLTNPTVPDTYKLGKIVSDVYVGRHVIIGAGTILLPGAKLAEGSAVGALSLVKGEIEPWTIYAGNPLRKIGARRQDLLKLEADYLQEDDNDG